VPDTCPVHQARVGLGSCSCGVHVHVFITPCANTATFPGTSTLLLCHPPISAEGWWGLGFVLARTQPMSLQPSVTYSAPSKAMPAVPWASGGGHLHLHLHSSSLTRPYCPALPCTRAALHFRTPTGSCARRACPPPGTRPRSPPR